MRIFFKKKNTQSGRSMVEILGVLAIIGVLSLGGIAGYRYAFDKYVANDVLNEANIRGHDMIGHFTTKSLPDTDEIGDFNRTPTVVNPLLFTPILMILIGQIMKINVFQKHLVKLLT